MHQVPSSIIFHCFVIIVTIPLTTELCLRELYQQIANFSKGNLNVESNYDYFSGHLVSRAGKFLVEGGPPILGLVLWTCLTN